MKIIVLNMCTIRDIFPLADIHTYGYERWDMQNTYMAARQLNVFRILKLL